MSEGYTKVRSAVYVPTGKRPLPNLLSSENRNFFFPSTSQFTDSNKILQVLVFHDSKIMCMDEELKSINQNGEDVVNGEEELFLETFDEFPFYDCNEIIHEQIESDGEVLSDSAFTIDSESVLEKLAQVNLPRRRFSSGNDDVLESNGLSSSVSFQENYFDSEAGKFKTFGDIDKNNEENGKLFKNLKTSDGIELSLSKEDEEHGGDEILKKEHATNSAISYVDIKKDDDLVEDESSLRETRDANSSILIILAGLVLKALRFQLNLLFGFFTFPIWLICCSYMFVMDPFRVLRRGRACLIRRVLRVWGCVFGNLSALVLKWLNYHKDVFKWGLKLGWGLLWSVYVCTVLVVLLVSAFLVGGLLIRIMVEEPIRMEERLDFDYTQKSPVAFVPIMMCPGTGYGLSSMENLEIHKLDGTRVIPPKHKLQVTISLTLPESDYNINLGIFQVRVDLLAGGGQVLASTRRPCMLQFKSHPIRLLLTFLKVAPLLTGYASETQDINLKFKGFTEGGTPTSCLRVTIEQRAQFQPASGIPEIYSSSLVLESEQPLLKRIMWSWRKTLFVWISLTMFIIELVFTLFCCTPIIIPKVRLRLNSPTNVTAASSSHSAADSE